MDAERNIRACEVASGDIVDLVRDELPADRRGEIARHLESCGVCAAEADAVRATLDAVRAVEVATSPGFREKAMARALASATDVDAAGIDEAVPSPAAAPGEKVHTPGPASRRLARIVARERTVTAWFRPNWRLMGLAGSAAACLAVVLLTEVWVLEGPDGRGGDDPRLVPNRPHPPNARRAVVARFMQRSDCALQHEARLEGTMLDMGNLALDGDEVVLTGAIDLSQEENCLRACRPTQWQAFTERATPLRGAPGRARWDVIAASKRVLPVRDGRIEIPDDLLARHVPDPDVVILRFCDRTEIWSRSQLASYLERGVPRSISVDIDDLG